MSASVTHKPPAASSQVSHFSAARGRCGRQLHLDIARPGFVFIKTLCLVGFVSYQTSHFYKYTTPSQGSVLLLLGLKASGDSHKRCGVTHQSLICNGLIVFFINYTHWVTGGTSNILHIHKSPICLNCTHPALNMSWNGRVIEIMFHYQYKPE